MWGFPVNGIWNGVMGMLQRNDADITWGHLFITTDRFSFMDFTDWYFMDPTCFLVPMSTNAYSKIYSALQPFSITVWLLTFAALFSMALFLILPTVKLNGNISGHYRASLLFAWGVLLSEQQHQKFSSTTVRIALACYFMGTLILSTGYCGIFKSMLMVNVYPAPIDTFEDLAKVAVENNWRVQGCCDNMQTAMQTSGLSSLESLAGQFDLYGWGYNNYHEQAIQNVSLSSTEQEQKYIMVDSWKTLDLNVRRYNKYTISPEGKAKVHITTNCFQPIAIALGLSKNSPFKSAINAKMIQLQEGGFISKWTIDGDFEHLRAEIVPETRIGLNQLEGPFVLHMLLCTLALICCMVEYASYKLF